MKQKYLRVTMPDGRRWDIPALFIAQHRAKAIVETDPETNFDAEVKFALNDEYEIQDWAANNMNWKDVELQVQMVNEDITADYQEGWVNGNKEIIER